MLVRWSLSIVAVAALAVPVAAMDFPEARHLLARTGFGGTPAEIDVLLPLTREQAVDALLASVRPTARLGAPEWCLGSLPAYLAERRAEYDVIAKITDEKERDKKGNERRELDRKRGRELKAWWFQEMITTDSPLTERLTLFWHNHFTSQFETVEDPRLMYEQNILLRAHGAANFGLFMLAIPSDPAMFRYLDSNSNTKGRPNENFAREVMELFTVGEGKYTESDIKEAARAFTGYKIDDKTGRAALVPQRHDAGKKNVLGHSGAFDGDEIIKVLLLREESVAIYLAGKMWNEFIHPELDDKEVYQLAAVFYRARYDLKTLLRATLLHPRFWDPATRGTLVKSPVELLVGGVRQLGLTVNNPLGLVQMSRRLGQDLMDPPNVKGWRGGDAWISTQSLLVRWEVIEELQRGKLAEKGEITFDDGGAMMAAPGMSGPATAKPGNAKPAATAAARKADPGRLSLVPTQWIPQAKGKGGGGVALAQQVLLPIAPAKPIKADAAWDSALKQCLTDLTFNLK